MVAIIGDNLAFSAPGIIGSDLVLPENIDIVGNGAGLFELFLPFSAGEFANTSDRYITAKNPSTGLYSITGPFGSNVLATRNIGGDTYGQFFRQVTEDIANTSYIEDMDSLTKYLTTVESDHIASPLAGVMADRVYASGASTDFHAVQYSDDPPAPGTHILGIRAKYSKGRRIALFRYVDTGGHYFVVTYDFISQTHSTQDSEGVVDSANHIFLEADWVFFWVTYTLTEVPSIKTTGIQLWDDAGNQSYQANGEEVYLWGFTSEYNASYPSFLKREKATYAPDYFYFPSAIVPTWMKSKFKVKLIPNYDIPLTTEDKPLWSFNKTASTLSTGNGYYGMDVNASHLFWANSGNKIQRCEHDGSNLTALISSGLSSPTDVTVDASYIYIVDRGSNKILRANLDGTGLSDFVTGLTNPKGICNDATYIYWTTTGGYVQRYPKAGGSVSDLVTSPVSTLSGIAVDDTYLYYTAGGGYQVKRILKGGGTAEMIISTTISAQYLAIADGYLYIGSYGDNGVLVTSVNNISVSKIVTEPHTYGVAALDGMVFWATSDSAIVKRRDSVTAWLTTTGTIKVVDGPDTKVETSAATASMHQNVEVEFDRVNGKITLSGFTTGDGEYTDTAWSDPDGYDVEYGCALKGAANFDGLCTVPKG